jgi:putative peptidoglycan lipid II flippase
MIGLIVLAKPIIETLFQHGAFKAEDTVATVEALRAYALGIPAFLLVKVFAAGFFARHDTKTPVKIAVVGMTVNVFASLLLLGLLQHIGIALANSIAVSVNAALLYRALRRKNMPIGNGELQGRIVKISLSAAIMAVATCLLTAYGWDVAASFGIMQKVVGLGALIVLSCVSYAVALHLRGAVRVRDVRQMVGRKGDE